MQNGRLQLGFLLVGAGTSLVLACSDAGHSASPTVGRVRAALDFGKLPELGSGQFAIEDRSVGMYQDFPVDSQAVTVRLDNPLVGWHGTMGVQQSDNGEDLPEEQVIHDPGDPRYISTYGDLVLTARGGDGPWMDRQLVGSVDDFRLPAYAREQGYASWRDPATFLTRGLRVGYTPLEIHGAMYNRRDANERRTSSKFVRLDPRVYLVPVEVWVFASEKYPVGKHGIVNQAAFWDQQHRFKTDAFTEPDLGRVKVTHIPAADVDGSRPRTWLNPSIDRDGAPVYLHGVSPWATPDSVLASCGVQFRMVQYRVIEGPDRLASPTIKSGLEERTDSYYEETAREEAPCDERATLALNHPDHKNGNLVVTFADRVEFPTSQAAMRVVSVGGQRVVCGTFSFLKAGPAALTHEIGHVAGLPDCDPANASCRLMISLGGGVIPPSPEECGAIRRWAYNRASHSWPGTTGEVPLEAPPTGGWSWPD